MTTHLETQPTDSAWPAAATLLDSLVRRDFPTLATCLGTQVRFRALVPPGPFELTGPDAVAGQFEKWFGGPDEFEVVDAAIGQVGERVYLRWRVHMNPAGTGETGRTAEQHVFATVTDRVDTLDLVCSGWQPDRPVRA
ncbi:nuclear transport factor 2 family protein [Nocardia sp. NBC_00511]|uniref:nuclear transport factor 2 family protein n=1 Tax=Nocardia sp. NBC_00511 TaxID=2903591 RepID=UPI0030E4EE54